MLPRLRALDRGVDALVRGAQQLMSAICQLSSKHLERVHGYQHRRQSAGTLLKSKSIISRKADFTSHGT